MQDWNQPSVSGRTGGPKIEYATAERQEDRRESGGSTPGESNDDESVSETLELEKYLANEPGVFIIQQFEFVEKLTRFELKNKYVIKSRKGEDLLRAFEDSSCIINNCCGLKKNLRIKIFDLDKNEIFRLKRPWRCQSCCFPCCLQSLEVFILPRKPLGWVKQEWSICKPNLAVYNEENIKIYSITGPVCMTKMCGVVEFKIISSDGEPVGKINRLWRGVLTEFIVGKMSEADVLELTFPKGADWKEKALIIGAGFLIDYMYFEHRQRKRK